MNRENYYKILFLIAAIWNWGMGVVFTLLTLFFLPIALPTFGAEMPPSLVWMHGFFFLIFVIGFAFFFASFNIKNNLAVVKFGIIDKFLIFPVMFIYFLLGDISFIAIIPAIIDIIFAVLFSECFFSIKNQKI
jgi:hypothetical protein